MIGCHPAHETPRLPTMLPPTIPLFPLPNVVLFPNVFLPLHIFEQRYRAMVSDALAGDRIIGMVLLRPGWEQDYEGRPPIYPVGCAGLITHAERLSDGRFNIVLQGLEKFRVLDEDDSLDIGWRASRISRNRARTGTIGTRCAWRGGDSRHSSFPATKAAARTRGCRRRWATKIS